MARYFQIGFMVQGFVDVYPVVLPRLYKTYEEAFNLVDYLVGEHNRNLGLIPSLYWAFITNKLNSGDCFIIHVEEKGDS